MACNGCGPLWFKFGNSFTEGKGWGKWQKNGAPRGPKSYSGHGYTYSHVAPAGAASEREEMRAVAQQDIDQLDRRDIDRTRQAEETAADSGTS